MHEVFPCDLTYSIEEEIEVLLKCPFHSSLEFALDRFRADEERFGVGLMVVITTSSAGMLFVGYNSRKKAACLGYASQVEVDAAKPSLPLGRSVAGGDDSVGFAEFHLFYPDCPSIMSEYETMTWPRVRRLVIDFAKSGGWSREIRWFDGR